MSMLKVGMVLLCFFVCFVFVSPPPQMDYSLYNYILFKNPFIFSLMLWNINSLWETSLLLSIFF